MSDCGYGWDAVRTISDRLINGIAEGASLSGPPCPHLSPPSGSLIKGSDSKIYVMRGGLKRHIPNPVTFRAERFRSGNVNHIADSALAAIPAGKRLLDALADGNLLKGSGGAVYVMEDGKRRHVTSLGVMSDCGYGWDAVRKISDRLINGIAEGASLSGPSCPHLSPPAGTLLRGSEEITYAMESALRRRIASTDVFDACGYLSGNVNDIADSSLNAISQGPDLTGEPCP
jgi:hypothetical protein